VLIWLKTLPLDNLIMLQVILMMDLLYKLRDLLLQFLNHLSITLLSTQTTLKLLKIHELVHHSLLLLLSSKLLLDLMWLKSDRSTSVSVNCMNGNIIH
jgi:hypothetical protein